MKERNIKGVQGRKGESVKEAAVKLMLTTALLPYCLVTDCLTASLPRCLLVTAYVISNAEDSRPRSAPKRFNATSAETRRSKSSKWSPPWSIPCTAYVLVRVGH